MRDKIAASKAKGMWMGGTIPLGYDVIDKKLVINQAEADTLRAIFAAFVRIRSVQGTLRWARREGLKTKLRERLGGAVGGKEFEYGSLRCLLSNRFYVGEIHHKGTIHKGQHEANVDRIVFDEAQAVLATLSADAIRGTKLVSGSLLHGLIVDRHGRTMGPAHTMRNGQRFRYYVTHYKTIKEGESPAYRLAAKAIESICCELLADHIAAQVNSIEGNGEAKRLAEILASGDHRQRRGLIIERVRKVAIGDASLSLLLNDGTIHERSLVRVRHGNDAKLLVGDLTPANDAKPDPQLVLLLKDAYRAQALALTKPNFTLDRLAKLFGRSAGRYKRLLRLSYLSPTTVGAIVAGEQPAHLTGPYLQHLYGLPLSWAE